MRLSITCPHRNSYNFSVQAITDIETKRRGCFSWLGRILPAICIFRSILIHK